MQWLFKEHKRNKDNRLLSRDKCRASSISSWQMSLCKWKTQRLFREKRVHVISYDSRQTREYRDERWGGKRLNRSISLIKASRRHFPWNSFRRLNGFHHRLPTKSKTLYYYRLFIGDGESPWLGLVKNGYSKQDSEKFVS